MVFNNTGINNISSLQGLAVYSNEHVSGILFSGGIMMLYFVALMYMSRRGEPFENVLAVVSWVFFIISGFFWYSHLIPTLIPLILLFITAFSTFYLYASKQ